MAPKTGTKFIPNRIFVAEAFREPLESLLERSWRLQDPKHRSWERLLAELGPKREEKTVAKMGPQNGPICLREPKRFQEVSGELFGIHSGAMLDPFGHQKQHPKGLQTPVCMSAAWHQAALQNSGSASMRWAGHWRACANSIIMLCAKQRSLSHIVYIAK